MDIVRIILDGYGCEVARGIITEEQHQKIKNSTTLDNIWVKGLYKYLGKKWKRIEEQLWDYGIINGDLKITVNNKPILDLPSETLSAIGFVDSKKYYYPNTDDVVMTTVQYHSGVIADVMFMIDGEFNIDKLKFIEKEVHNENNEIIIDSLISEIWYDDYKIPLEGSSTDLRMSNVYFDTNDNEFKKRR
jgi:hypothetical protein